MGKKQVLALLWVQGGFLHTWHIKSIHPALDIKVAMLQQEGGRGITGKKHSRGNFVSHDSAATCVPANSQSSASVWETLAKGLRTSTLTTPATTAKTSG